jgi:hypothetical protein
MAKKPDKIWVFAQKKNLDYKYQKNSVSAFSLFTIAEKKEWKRTKDQ